MIFDVVTLLWMIMALAGAGLLATSVVMLQQRLPLWWRGIRVTGTIVRWERTPGQGTMHGGTTPWIRFTDGNGTAHVIRLNRSFQFRRGRPGTPHPLRYSARTPAQALDDSVMSLYIMPLTVLAAGILVLLLAAGMAFGR